MCGRFAYFGKGAFGHESLHLPEPPRFENYNITPSQDILAIRTSPETGHPEYTMLHWGLVPFWSKSVKTKFPLINARSEGIETKPSFRDPFKRRRCIIPASGFYEWQKVEEHKQPYFIRPVDGRYFSLAGLWDSWRGENGAYVNTCAIITTMANATMKEIHDRMPVILGDMNIAAWLDSGKGQTDLLAMLEPYPESLIEIYPVSSMVNSPRNNGPECVKRSLPGASS
jgi:putative SOS response-associated peptidase YedK